MKTPLTWIALVLGSVAVFVVAVMGVEALIDSSVREVKARATEAIGGRQSAVF